MKRPISLALSEELIEAVDARRGQHPRSTFVESALRALLALPPYRRTEKAETSSA